MLRFGRRILPFFLVLSLLLAVFTIVQAQDSSPQNKIQVYFFWGDGCPHCVEQKVFFEGLKAKYPDIVVNEFEVYYIQENQARLMAMASQFGFTASAVPTTFIGDQYWVGFSEQMGQQMENYIQFCLAGSCPDAATPGESGTSTTPDESTENPAEESFSGGNRTIDLPLIGTINLDAQALWVSTALIAFVDGFNPCSLWVLSMLMALVLHTGSRRKIFIVGFIFLTVTSLVYAIFIAGLFSVLSFVTYLGWVEVLVALVALAFALVNIKDYFWYKQGLSMTISDDKKPGIFEKMRRVLDASDSLWGLAGATIVLAAGVSLVEFTCTAGFPVLWTNLLTSQGVDTSTFIGLLVLYMLIYQIDELVIFMAVVFTLRASRFEEKHGRILKLVGGVLMLTLAVIMILNPALMNSLSSSLIIFGSAFLLAALILVVHRWVLPKFGIWIGTREGEPRKRKKHSNRH